MVKLFRSSMQTSLLKARDAWMEAMSRYRDDRGLVCPPVPVMLDDWHLAGCELVASRESLIRKMPRGERIAELGVLAGDFSQVLLATCAPAELHLIDLDLRSHRVAERFANQVDAGIVTLHEGDSVEVMSRFPNGHFSFVYIDADHGYEGVRRDIELAKQKIRTDGFLIFNDYTFWSPVECLPYGVMPAVNEFCLREGWRVRYFALDPYMYCDVAIQRMRFDRP